MIPATAGEVTPFTPPSLANLDPAPSFRFRAVTWADRRRFHDALNMEGLRFHGDDAVRAEVRRGLRELWSEDQHAAQIGRLESFWAMVDYAATDPDAKVDQGEIDAAAELLTEVLDNWPPLRRMTTDNARFNAIAPQVALSLFLTGWSHIDAPFRRAAGQVDMEAVHGLERALLNIEERAVADKVDGALVGTAFLQLAAHAVSLLNVSESMRKKSPSPSSPTSDPNGSTAISSASSPATGSRRASTRKPASARRK